MTSESLTVTIREITAAAALVDLPLSGPDADQLVGLLAAWMPAAVALSTRMQQVEELGPITAFTPLSGIQGEEVK